MLTSNDSVWPVDMFGIVDLDIQFLDWLFSLEGVKVAADPSGNPSNREFGDARDDVGWYATFRKMQFVGRGIKGISDNSTRDVERFSHPVQNLMVSTSLYQSIYLD